jgi:hypothetical protein
MITVISVSRPFDFSGRSLLVTTRNPGATVGVAHPRPVDHPRRNGRDHPVRTLSSVGPAKADRRDEWWRHARVERVVVDVTDEDPVARRIRRRPLDRRFSAEQRGDFRVLGDLTGQPETEVIAEDVAWVRHEALEFGWTRRSFGVPLIPIRVCVGAGFCLGRDGIDDGGSHTGRKLSAGWLWR